MTTQQATQSEMTAHYQMADHRGYNPQYVGKTRIALNVVNPRTGKMIWDRKGLRELMAVGLEAMIKLA